MTPRRDPPRLAGWLLDRVDPRGIVRGDLEEEYHRFRLPERGPVRADLWFWGQALRTVPRLLLSVGPSTAIPASRGYLADLSQAWRALRRRRSFAALTILTFALALGANASVFSLLDSVVLRPLPFANEARLVRINPDEAFYIQLADAQDIAGEASSIETGLPWGRTLFTFTDTDPAEEVRGARVVWNHFEALGAPPLLGRTFSRQDAAADPPDAVLLAHTLWVRRFGADPTVIGRRVTIGSRTWTVIGVMGPDHVPMEPDWEAWAPLPLDVERASGLPLAMNALLRPGVSVAQAQDEVRRAFASQWARDGDPATPEELAALRVIPLREHLLGSVTRPLQVVWGAVLFVLLLACANVSTLLLAQGEARAAEVSVRASLGAGRPRILRQLLFEVLILASLGALAGMGLAWALHGWGASRLPASLPRAGQWNMGGAAMIYTAFAALAAALLSGALPSWRTAGGSGAAESARGVQRRSTHRVSAVLVTAEVATAVLLVVGAGLMIRSFAALRAVDPGFDPDHAIAVRVVPPSERYEGADALDAFYSRLRDAALAIPGVQAAGGIMFLPMTPGGAWSMYRVQDAEDVGEESPRTAFRVVTPGYFETMGIPLLAGRALSSADRAETAGVVLINQKLARDAFGTDDPIGRVLLMGRSAPEALEVVGVVGDVRQSDLRNEADPELYRPLAQSPVERMYVVARGPGDPSAMLAALQSAVLSVDGEVVLSRPSRVRDIVGASLTETRLVAQLLSLFGAVALMLGAVGVYGVTANGVARRTREIGVRLALGAAGNAVARRTVATGMIPVAAGLALGTAGALLLSRVMESLLFSVGTRDPLTFAAVPLLFGAVALASLALPAIRASRVDPVRALRSE